MSSDIVPDHNEEVISYAEVSVQIRVRRDEEDQRRTFAELQDLIHRYQQKGERGAISESINALLSTIWSFDVADVYHKKKITMLFPRVLPGYLIWGFSPRTFQSVIADTRVLKREYAQGNQTRAQITPQLTRQVLGLALVCESVDILDVGGISNVILKAQVADVLFRGEELQESERDLLEKIFAKVPVGFFLLPFM